MQNIITKNKYGQYFTPYEIANFMVKLSNKEKDKKILEPSCGEGVFIDSLISNGFKNITALEIDNTLINKYEFIKYESFITKDFQDEKFDLIIGNPPYIRWKNLEDELKNELIDNILWKKYFNSLCDYLYIFILKSIEILNDKGELIFICPEYWMNTTHAISLRNYMVENGYFESIYHFNETPIFDNVNVSIIIFKYIKSKNKIDNKINVFKYISNKKLNSSLLKDLLEENNNEIINQLKISQFNKNERWILENDNTLNELKKLEEYCINYTYELFPSENKYSKIGDICDIGNGMVSGLDKVFQIPKGQNLNNFESKNTINVLKAKSLDQFNYTDITKYIFINDSISTENELIEQMPNFYENLSPYKDKLLKRYMYNRDIKYWEWVFLRNYKLFSKPIDKIFIPCKERISHKDYFRFTYVEKNIYPTQDVTAIYKKDNIKESIFYILSFLNLPIVFNWIKNHGIVKGNIVEFSEKPISSIPFRKIDWNNPNEIRIHDNIVKLTKEYVENNNNNNKTELINFFNLLFLKKWD